MVHFTGSDIVLFVIAVFLPPLAVLFKEGCGWDFLISVALTIFGYIPGVLHAWWVIYTNREDPRTGRRLVTRTPSGSQRRSYVQVASQPPPDGAAPPPGVIKSYKVVEQRVTQRSVPQGQGVSQGQVVSQGQAVSQGQGLPQGHQVGQIIEQQQGGTQQYTTTTTKTLPHGQQYTTTTTTTSGPVRTTHTTYTTQYVVSGTDKKDQNPTV